MPDFSEQDKKQIAYYFNDLVGDIHREFTDPQILQLHKALEVAYDGHFGQERKISHEPYITHPIAVAKIVANDIGFGLQSVICALLHDVVEDSEGKYTLEDIKGLFGEQVAAIVDGLTKMTGVSRSADKNDSLNIDQSVKDEKLTTVQLETLKNVALISIKDIRVIYIKIADRLHNMRTMQGMHENTKLRKAGENVLFYAPFAFRLGLYLIKKELEDLSFQINNTKDFRILAKVITEEEAKRQPVFDELISKINDKLKSESVDIRTELFSKSYYSTWLKMEARNCPFDEIYNQRSIRVIFGSSSDTSIERRIAYQIYAEITSILQIKEDSWHDYIKEARRNGFQAFIFSVFGKDSLKFCEIQIMSERMRQINDYGPLSIASKSYFYDDSFRKDWIKKLIRQLKSPSDNALDFVSNLSLEFLSEIVVYSPKGQPFKLPRGSTVLDFAFLLHTDLGFKCIGANADDYYVSNFYCLKKGQRIFIYTNDNANVTEDWLSHVQTTRAKEAISNYLNKRKSVNIKKGKAIFNTIITDTGIIDRRKILSNILRYYQLKENEFYVHIDKEIIPKDEIYRLINKNSLKSNNSFWQNIFQRTNENSFLPIETSSEIDPKKSFAVNPSLIYRDYFIAHCCNPIPGDEAVIFLNRHGAKIIHKKQCKTAIRLMGIQGRKSTSVKWINVSSLKFPAKIQQQGKDRQGLILDCMEIITENMDINMYSVNFKNIQKTKFIGEIVFFVPDLENLNKLIALLLKVKNIDKVTRIDKFEIED